jgi:hypothetical protein
VDGQGHFLASQLGRLEAVGEYRQTVDERHLGGGIHAMHTALWPRWKDTSQAKLPNLLI